MQLQLPHRHLLVQRRRRRRLLPRDRHAAQALQVHQPVARLNAVTQQAPGASGLAAGSVFIILVPHSRRCFVPSTAAIMVQSRARQLSLPPPPAASPARDATAATLVPRSQCRSAVHGAGCAGRWLGPPPPRSLSAPLPHRHPGSWMKRGTPTAKHCDRERTIIMRFRQVLR